MHVPANQVQARRVVPVEQRPGPPNSAWSNTGWLLILVAMGIYLAAWLLGDPTARGLIMGPLVVILLMPILLRVRRTEHRFDLFGIMLTGLGLKLCAVYGRLWMVDHLFDGSGDSFDYDLFGRQYSAQLRAFQFDLETAGPVPGTGFLRLLTGVVYSIFGDDRFTGYIVFGTLAYLGCWFFYRAFSTAVPDGDLKRYAMLVFFWPSLVFWPSSIGKEAWMTFALGLASAGAAAAYSRRRLGYPLLGLGILAAAMPRPHIAIVVLAAAGMGLVMATVFGAGAAGRKTTLATKVIGVSFLVVAAAILAPQVASFLEIEDAEGSGLGQALERTELRTTQGGSEFTAPSVKSPADYPWAITTVLFRPFVYEVSSAASAISALEGMLLLALIALSANRLVRLPIVLMRNAYMAYAGSFTFMFVYVFSFIGNFGILARQRIQLLPFLFVLLALPVSRRGADDNEGEGLVSPATPNVAPDMAARRPHRGAGITVSPPRPRP